MSLTLSVMLLPSSLWPAFPGHAVIDREGHLIGLSHKNPLRIGKVFVVKLKGAGSYVLNFFRQQHLEQTQRRKVAFDSARSHFLCFRHCFLSSAFRLVSISIWFRAQSG